MGVRVSKLPTLMLPINCVLFNKEALYVSGPVLLENWSHFDKREVLSFEGWETQAEAATRKLYGQLRDIDGNRDFPAALCIPAASL